MFLPQIQFENAATNDRSKTGLIQKCNGAILQNVTTENSQKSNMYVEEFPTHVSVRLERQGRNQN